MANEPKINLALVSETPENPVRGTVYMSPDSAEGFLKVGVGHDEIETIFDSSHYIRKDESVWMPGEGENSAVLTNSNSLATGTNAVTHGIDTWAKGNFSHAEGQGIYGYYIIISSIREGGYYTEDIPASDIYIGYNIRYNNVSTVITSVTVSGEGVIFTTEVPLSYSLLDNVTAYLISAGIASGTYSHVEGGITVATGDYSHAEGYGTYASGTSSHAEGEDTVAYSYASHAEGNSTLIGNGADNSHAEGDFTQIYNINSHAEGSSTTALGSTSHVEGLGHAISATISGDNGSKIYTTNNISLDSIKKGDIVRYIQSSNSYTSLPYERRITTPIFAYIEDITYDDRFIYLNLDRTLSNNYSLKNVDVDIISGVSYGANSHAEGEYTSTIGISSHAEGINTVAFGNGSHAEGNSTVADASNSHAEGYDTIASGDSAHAEGYNTEASGNYSHAEGDGTNASGICSHAEGENTQASGDYSHTEGEHTTASAIGSHAEGDGTKAFGNYSHAEGESTKAFGNYSHAEGLGSIESLSFTISGNANVTVYTTNIVHNLNVYDVLEYNGIIAIVLTVGNKDFTVDHTLSNTQLTNASGLKKIGGISYGNYSHAEGGNTKAYGNYSHAEGSDTRAYGIYSHAEGFGTMAINYSHAEGTNTRTLSSYSHAEGNSTKTSGEGSHAEGNGTTAYGKYSHTEGSITSAYGIFSHAEGHGTNASGSYSHAEGQYSTAYGNYSHAEGYFIHANNDYEHAQGMLNISRDNTLFSIGNGYEDTGADPSKIYRNALEIMRNGDAYLYGVASFDGQTIGSNRTLQYFLNINPISNYEYDIIFGNNADSAMDFDTLSRLRLYIDDYPSDMISDMMEEVGAETIEEFYDIVYDVNVNGNTQYEYDGISCVYANEYVFEDTVEIDGTIYYLWYDSDHDMYAIMRTDVSIDYLDSIAKCNNPNSDASPFTAIVTEDLAVRYDDTTAKTVNNGFQLACYKIDEE